MDWRPDLEAFIQLVRKLVTLLIFVGAEQFSVGVISRMHPHSYEIELFVRGANALTVIGSLIYFMFDWLELLYGRWVEFRSRRGGRRDRD